MSKKKIFFWASDYSNITGEGRLGRLYIKYYSQKQNTNLEKIKISKNKFLNYKYISPFCGIFFAWVYFFKKKKFIYLNYLPYWNFLIFLLLPPRCKIGPITGGAKFTKISQDYYIRKFIFPILYFLSGLILRFRFEKLIFSTDLLKKNLNKAIIKKSEFNFIFNEIKINKKINYKNKKIFFLFYFRKHKNKKYYFLKDFLKKLILKKLPIVIIGDKLNLKGLKNCGYISHKKVTNLLHKTRYSSVSNENIFSFFTIDCINNNVKLLIDKKSYSLIKNHKKYFINYDFKKNNLKKLNI